jgi:hypothetical protein
MEPVVENSSSSSSSSDSGPDASSSSSAPSAAAAPAPLVDPANDPSLERVYSCRSCRSWLCRPSQEQSPPHEIGQHVFSHHRVMKDAQLRAGGAIVSGSAAILAKAAAPKLWGGGHDGAASASEGLHATPCTSIFLAEALKWMEEASSDVEGKLLCYSCKARVGVIKWAGSQCSCGTWVTPAIQLYKKALDERFVPKNKGGAGGGGLGAVLEADEGMKDGDGVGDGAAAGAAGAEKR